jgi:hypothetical protein
MRRLVGIAGLAGSEKAAAADFFADECGMRVVSFAFPVKAMAAALLLGGFCYDRASVCWYLANKDVVIPDLGVSMRRLLKTLGTDWGRNGIAHDIWAQSAASRVSDAFGDDIDVVVDDVCSEEEASFIRSNGGLLIHLVRPGVVRGDHVSESGVEVGARDVVIVKCGSQLDLFKVIDEAAKRFLKQDDELLRLCLTPCAEYWV